MVSPWKERIQEWDEPSADNDKICKRFAKREYEGHDLSIPYRLFLPKNAQKCPLILFLHGADVTGRDNELQIGAHDIGTVFVRDIWQKVTPSVIVAPQYDNGYHWSRPATMEALTDMVEGLCHEYPMIDPDRLLVYGYSAGGIGALKLIKRAPGFFKKAIIMCAATDSEEIESLSSTPMWLFHAVDDDIVPNHKHRFFGGSHLGSALIYEALKEKMGDDIHYTEYAPGELMERYGVNPHCAWVPVAEDEDALRWFLEK